MYHVSSCSVTINMQHYAFLEKLHLAYAALCKILTRFSIFTWTLTASSFGSIGHCSSTWTWHPKSGAYEVGWPSNQPLNCLSWRSLKYKIGRVEYRHIISGSKVFACFEIELL